MSPRIANSLYKLFYRYTHSRAHRHNERLWPHVAIGRDAEQRIASISYRGSPLPLARREPAPRASLGTCHIIASGPSINQIAYDELALAHVMGVNGAIALADTQPVRFDYYCFNDTGFVRNRPELVRKVMTRDLLLFTTPLCLWYVLQQMPMADIRCRIFPIELPQTRALMPARDMAEVMADNRHGAYTLFDGPRALGFSHDIRRGAFNAGTIAYTALQIMVWLGYSEIILHGVDLKEAASVPRFYETQADKLPTTLDQYLHSDILPAFKQAARMLHGSGVRIVNLSPDSALAGDEFEARDWRSLVAHKPLAAADRTAAQERPCKTG